MISETLIAGCARQDPKAQFQLYRELYPMMMSICTRYERNKQDAVARMNQGFLKVLENIGKRRPEVPFELWTRRILINTVIDDFRRNKERKQREVNEADHLSVEHSEVNDYLQHMEAEAFADLLRSVPPASRNVFNLFAIDGYTHHEIANMLDISEGTSKWHVANARNILQQAIARLAIGSTAQTASR